MTRKLWIAALAVLVVTLGLIFVPRFLSRSRQVTYAVELWGAMRTLPQLRVSFGGQPVQHLNVKTIEQDKFHHTFLSSISFEARGDPRTTPTVAAEALFPCGWKRLNVDLQKSPGDQEIRHADESGQPARISGLLDRLPSSLTWSLKFLVDNRAGGAAQLSVGQVVLAIPAGASGMWDFPPPACEQGSVIRLNGTQVGTVPKEQWWPPTKTPTDEPFLIDTSGQRCYRSRQLEYAPKGGIAFVSPETHYYNRRALHQLALYSPEFFLEPAPKEIPASVALFPELQAEVVHELIEVPCG